MTLVIAVVARNTKTAMENKSKRQIVGRNKKFLRGSEIFRCLFFLLNKKSAIIVIIYFYEVKEMELADIRNELEKTAKKLADFRGSL